MIFFAKKAFQMLVKSKGEGLDHKYKTSHTCCNFEIFNYDHQLDIKFWSPQRSWLQCSSLYISKYIHVIYIHKLWIKLKDTFDIPSHPSIHSICKLVASRLVVYFRAGLRRETAAIKINILFFRKKGLPSAGENNKRTFRSKNFNVKYLLYFYNLLTKTSKLI